MSFFSLTQREDYFADNLFYVFVNLKQKNERPDFYIVPSKTVAAHTKVEHKKWLKKPGRKAQLHRDNPMRMFRDDKQIYLEKWELLGL